ncbi:hypothetical protein M433DRAFT_152953 [Acidomyces richmondensis BFW]|nr:MAG: hypothetical protein FE78DRAFT_88523 [Acidomyces sp. 'richmondensis']KYG46808.1 hypothetical protein M433DRAFT_152953 [Acidomyces richmondensis BFW]
MAKGKEVSESQKRKEKPSMPSQFSRSKSSALSQEFVLDSDDEQHVQEQKDVKNSSEASLPSKTVLKPNCKSSQTPSKTPAKSASEYKDRSEEEGSEEEESEEEESEEEESEEEESKEEESEEDEGDEDESEEDKSEEDKSSGNSLPDGPIAQKPQQIPVKTNGIKRMAENQSSGEESEESDEEDEISDEPPPKKARIEDDEVVSSDSSEDEIDETAHEENEKLPQGPKANSFPQVTTTSPSKHPAILPADPFQPPAGFVPLTIPNEVPGVPAGEHIWHITAPSDVPLSSITEVALTAIQSGQPILRHKGSDYVLSEGTQGDSHLAVLLPQRDGYSLSNQRVEKTLQLHQKITLPNPRKRQASQIWGAEAAADLRDAAASNIRLQPKGLRMRYKPSGFGRGRPSMIASSESEDENEGKTEKPSFQFPRTLRSDGTPGFHVRECPKTAADIEISSQKTKKKRKEPSKLVVEGVEARTRSEESHQRGTSKTVTMSPTKNAAMPDSEENRNAPPLNGIATEKRSKEEKAKQKDERRKGKEAKIKRKEVEV